MEIYDSQPEKINSNQVSWSIRPIARFYLHFRAVQTVNKHSDNAPPSQVSQIVRLISRCARHQMLFAKRENCAAIVLHINNFLVRFIRSFRVQ